MKRLFALLLCLIILCCFAGCDDRFKHLYPDDFYCMTRGENNVAIGMVRTFPESGAVFFPEKIENYTVTQLVFSKRIWLWRKRIFLSARSGRQYADKEMLFSAYHRKSLRRLYGVCERV